MSGISRIDLTSLGNTAVTPLDQQNPNGITYLKGNATTNGSFRLNVNSGSCILEKLISGTWTTLQLSDINVNTYQGNQVYMAGTEPLIDVTKMANYSNIDTGSYRGVFPTTSAGLANAAKGDWWRANTSGTLLGQSYASGDELNCNSNVVGTPTTLANFNYVPSNMSMATESSAGLIQLGSATPLANGVAAKGISTSAAHADHVHPSSVTPAFSIGWFDASNTTSPLKPVFSFNGNTLTLTGNSINLVAGKSYLVDYYLSALTIPALASYTFSIAMSNGTVLQQYVSDTGSSTTILTAGTGCSINFTFTLVGAVTLALGNNAKSVFKITQLN